VILHIRCSISLTPLPCQQRLHIILPLSLPNFLSVFLPARPPVRLTVHLPVCLQVITGICSGCDVDLVDLIQAAREDRMCMVQHTSQYLYAHEACVSFAKRHVTSAGSTSGHIYALATTKRHLESIDKDPRWRKTSTKEGLDKFVLDMTAKSPASNSIEEA